ncbi:MogA/MoaB family molybdenum cofactor biosynthesis protein [Corynebacterium phoceense]|uniref:MogA/MoaB family molybdenum cofactor biosynthesis protein n=1 Tax=Corynebacterium phoceense TaxID=1686286 RepID=UPI00211C1556|nr:MogA/MoaB family molybdenum cofactor biosynthesis protein [Corynebacterium phoceense]MCQ9341138.1 MogA/MoaB family molybdenum cofactor biosynthesis protein [Corynebacterium phoceense]
MARTGIVIVASTRAAAGTYEDRSGPIAVEFLRAQGLECADASVVPDADIRAAVDQAFAENPAVILTSGGTGLSPDDQTVEALEAHLERTLPGIAHAFYAASASVPTAPLSRTVAGTRGTTFAMALPGSTGGVKDGVKVLAPILGHIIEQLEGKHEH